MCPKDGVIAGVIGNAKLLTALCALGALLATGCSGSSNGPEPTVSVAMTAFSPGPTPTAPLSGIRGCSPECATGITNPGALPAGSYTTTYIDWLLGIFGNNATISGTVQEAVEGASPFVDLATVFWPALRNGRVSQVRCLAPVPAALGAAV